MVADNKQRYKAYPEYKDSEVEWLGDIPSHWELIRLKHVVDLEGSKTNSNKERYVGLENIESKTGHYLKTEDVIPEGVSNTFHQDNVLFGKLRPYLAKSWLATFSGICSSEFLVLNSQLVHPKFLNYFTLTEGFIEAVNSSTYGTKMPRASWDFISLLHVPIMDYGLSEHIANFLDYETAKIDTLIEKQQRLIELLTEKRQAVISQAVTKGLNSDVPMKDSGVEWLGEVPEHWEVSKAKYVSNVFVPQRNKPELNDTTGLPWITMEDMKTDYITKAYRFVMLNALKRSGSRVLEAGAVIASCVGNFGVTSINKVDVIINQQLQAFIPFNIKAEYLRAIVSLSKEYFELIGTSATLVYVNKEGFENLPIIIPTPEEQSAICKFVSKETQRFNKLINKAEQAIQLMQERRTALISAAVTGKIDVRDWVKPE